MPRRQPPLGVERLEDRAVPATFFVDNNADAGPGSLRQALADADLSPTADVIQVRGLLSGTITLNSTLTTNNSVDIQGPGAGAVTVAGKNAFTVFNVVSIGNPVIR